MLSPWSKLLLQGKSSSKGMKLSGTLYDKEHYITHIYNLQLYMSLGIMLKKVFRTMKFTQFTQSAWLCEYIEFNSARRATAVSKVEKDFYKLQINSVFGKMLQNERKYKKFVVCKSPKKLQVYLSKATLKDVIDFGDGGFLLEMMQLNVKLTRPVFVGVAYLEFAKRFMTHYHYKVMIPRFGRRNIHYSTRTLIVSFGKRRRETYTKILSLLRMTWTFQGFFNHPLYNSENNCVRGKWKDELGGDLFCEGVFLRSKTYSIIALQDSIKAMAGV